MNPNDTNKEFFTLYYADVREDSSNLFYPHTMEVRNRDDLKKAVCRDHTSILFESGKRSSSNFVKADCVILDVDNSRSENPAEWIEPEHIEKKFPGVRYAINTSRHHEQPKEDKASRSRFHVIFPTQPINTAEDYAALVGTLTQRYPFFDPAAKDAGRFFFGTEEPKGRVVMKGMTIDEFLKQSADCPADHIEQVKETYPAETSAGYRYPEWKTADVIPEGMRNNMLYEAALDLLIYHGDESQARAEFDMVKKKCIPPLPEAEVERIWNSARKTAAKIRSKPGYLPKAQYLESVGRASAAAVKSAFPEHWTDVGQADVLKELFGNELRYCESVGYLVYDEVAWRAGELAARKLSAELTRLQMEEAQCLIEHKKLQLATLGISTDKNQKTSSMDAAQKAAFEEYQAAVKTMANVEARQQDARLQATLNVASPKLSIAVEKLDADPFLLNTPGGTIDLRMGASGMREHSAADYITKVTRGSMHEDVQGRQLWMQTLEDTFKGDQAIIDYVQLLCGLMLLGSVKQEGLIIAYGCGANGKSTFFNAIREVMGDYADTIAADVFLSSTTRNVMPERAALRGKRLVLAEEMPNHAPLSASVVKQLCSTDAIHAEQKFKDPFTFKPSHTLVLMTNSLPEIRDRDEGIWRRIHLIPFEAQFTGDRDVKDYASKLVEKAGGEILSWMVEGACKVIAADYGIEKPAHVKAVEDEYRRGSDWLGSFLEDCSEKDPDSKVLVTELYSRYCAYCRANALSEVSREVFGKVMGESGFKAVKSHGKRYRAGLRLKGVQDFDQ